jgi:hypothetical protein
MLNVAFSGRRRFLLEHHILSATHVPVFYHRGELAWRLANFYAANNIASAFGGLLSFGVIHAHSGSFAD